MLIGTNPGTGLTPVGQLTLTSRSTTISGLNVGDVLICKVQATKNVNNYAHVIRAVGSDGKTSAESPLDGTLIGNGVIPGNILVVYVTDPVMTIAVVSVGAIGGNDAQITALNVLIFKKGIAPVYLSYTCTAQGQPVGQQLGFILNGFGKGQEFFRVEIYAGVMNSVVRNFINFSGVYFFSYQTAVGGTGIFSWFSNNQRYNDGADQYQATNTNKTANVNITGGPAVMFFTHVLYLPEGTTL